LSITFRDAKGTYKEQSLRSFPPTLEFAPIQRIPTTKQRVDGRQGTIDQDSEFIAFLESETQPATRPAALDNAVSEKSKEKVTSTPLIEALREKKAHKAKTAAAKAAKREEAKDDKSTEKAPSSKAVKDTQGDSKSHKKLDQALKDAAKAANKEAAKTTAATDGQKISTISSAASPSPAKKRERAPQNIKSMLQRDLGLNAPSKRGTKSTAQGSPEKPAAQMDTASTSPAPDASGGKTTRAPKKARDQPLAERSNGQDSQQGDTKVTAQPMGIVKKPSVAQATPREPKGKPNEQAAADGHAVLKGPSQTSVPGTKKQPPTTAAVARPARSTPQPTPGATKAYLKHANASQSVNEPLLRTALSEFGEIISLDIDKRKGTATAEFASHDGLKAAMAMRSVPVGQGAVEVLEHREKLRPVATMRGGAPPGRGGAARGRGRGSSGRGGSSMASAAASNSSNSVSNSISADTALPSSADAT